MKSLFIILAVVASFFTSSSFASEEVNPSVLRSFNRTFKDATAATWTVTEDFHTVQFTLGQQQITANYNEKGHLISVGRNISSFQLPILLQAEIKNKYADYWISNLFELSSDNGTDYYVTLEDADNKIILKSHSNSAWSVYNKSSK